MIIKITDKQAKVIREACELYARLHLGQLDELKHINITKHARSYVTVDYRIELLKLEMFPELTPNAYHGIRSPEIPDDVRIAYDLHQVIRKHFAGEKPEGSFPYVQYDPPIKTSDEPLAEVREQC